MTTTSRASTSRQSNRADAPPRPGATAARRIVVKLGTRVLADDDGNLVDERILPILDAAAELRRRGRELIFVSSGAVAIGRAALQVPTHKSSSLRPVCAAVGQATLMSRYQTWFESHDLTCGQLLVGQRDFDDRGRTLRLRSTLDSMLEQGLVPVINENDALSQPTDSPDRVFHDNDRLAALVAGAVGADLLVLLTDVPGLFDCDPRKHPEARLLSTIESAAQLPVIESGSGSPLSLGGMRSKVEAALIAARGGCSTLIAPGTEPDAFSRSLSGEEIGTWFPAAGKLDALSRWIAFATTPRGRLVLDGGAVEALVSRGASLLAAGVVSVGGDFRAGEVVELIGPDEQVVGRARCRLSAAGVRRRCRHRRSGGAVRQPALVRRNDIVLNGHHLKEESP